MSYPYLIQGDNIVVNIDHKVYTVSKANIAFNKLLEAIKTGDWESVKDLVDPKKVIINYGNGNISVKGDEFYWKDKILDNSITRRIIKMLVDGFDISPMVAFMDNLMQNPSNTAINELYLFLENNNLPITPDGHFLAYKKVTENFLDYHSETIDNSVGQLVSMERNMVDDDRNSTCSHGLHFCSRDYLSNFGGSSARTILLKINPRDVVSIPRDYNNSKGRCCMYEVKAELDVEIDDIENKPVYEDAFNVDVDGDTFLWGSDSWHDNPLSF